MGELNDHGMSSGGTPGLSDGLRRLIDHHRSDSERAQEALRQMPGSDGRCELYEERGSVEFFEGNRVRLRARAQMIGTYSPAESTWEWSWANPDLSPNLIAATLSLRESTESALAPEFREPSFTCSENEAWAVAGVARGLLHAHSV